MHVVHAVKVTYLPVKSDGLIDMAELEAAMRPDTVLVSIMAVNNEIGAPPDGNLRRPLPTAFVCERPQQITVRHLEGWADWQTHRRGIGGISKGQEQLSCRFFLFFFLGGGGGGAEGGCSDQGESQ